MVSSSDLHPNVNVAGHHYAKHGIRPPMAQPLRGVTTHPDILSPEYADPRNARMRRLDFMIDIRAEYYYIYLKKMPLKRPIRKVDVLTHSFCKELQ